DKLKLLASRKAADSTSAAVPVAVPATEEDDLPIPSDINTVFLGGLFLLGMLAACYLAAEIVLPIVLAFVLSLVLHPAMRAFEPGTSAARDCGHAHHPAAIWQAFRRG